jgi:hypothetical protein
MARGRWRFERGDERDAVIRNFRLDARAASATTARRLVRRVLSDGRSRRPVAEACIADAELIVTELVTNAV